MTLKRNEHGLLIRAKNYGQTSYDELAKELGLGSKETLYRAGVEMGVRKGRPVKPGGKVDYKPGDVFIVGPTITKAAFGLAGDNPAITKKASGGNPPPKLKEEIQELQAAGFGSVPAPEMSPWGWSVRLKGVVLPDGTRSDAMILLPNNYPLASPIGFYLKNGALTGKLDTSHLFGNRAYHGALDLSAEGWQWFCGIAEGWQANRHTLLSYITIVFALFNDLEH